MLPYDAVPLALVLVEVVVRVEILVADLDVVASTQAPVALEQAHIRIALAGRPVVGHQVGFREPRDRSGSKARVNAANLAIAEIRVVVVVACPEPPTRSDI